MLRQRHTKNHPLNIVRKLDAFPKIPDEYKVGTRIGGLLSILSRLLIVVLLYKEIEWYYDSDVVFKFQPDTHMDAKLKIHIDLTVATRCRSIGADILDSTNQNVFSFGVLEEEDTWWDLCPRQREHFEYVQSMNGYLREEWHSVTHLVFKSLGEQLTTNQHSDVYNLPPRSDKPARDHDACRIHGELTLNKVAGNFHIIGGKSLHFPRGHVHISPMFEEQRQNFSHRINRFSFGDAALALVHPLEGDEKVFERSAVMAQYFLDVVPTEIESLLSNVHTYQYSVKENIRPVDHERDSHGIPGIYFKYDMSALRIAVRPDRENLATFVIRLGSIISGIVVISGVLNAWLQNVWLAVQRRCHPEDARLRKMSAPRVAVGPQTAYNLLLNAAAAVPVQGPAQGYVYEVVSEAKAAAAEAAAAAPAPNGGDKTAFVK